jgi:hypothetical protein
LPENANVTSRRWGKSTKKPDKLCSGRGGGDTQQSHEKRETPPILQSQCIQN